MVDKKNILLVANWESNVGYAWWLMENFWTTISAHFQKEGRTCFLIYPKISEIPESIRASDIEVLECDFHDHSITNLKKLDNIIKSNNIQAIYLTDSLSYSYFYLLLRFFGIKKIIVHDHTPGERTPAASWRKPVKSLIQRIPLYTADHFIAVTEYVFKRFIEVACIPENKCSVAPNGIKPIDLNDADLKYAYHTFNIPKDRLIVVTTGRASYYKGIDFFIQCANEMVNNRNIHELHFLFCGDGPDMKDFMALTKRYGINDFFTFAGKRTDVRKILPSCDIGFHTSKGEVGYSLSILEYMSAGLATLTPDSPSVSESIENNETGILYKTGDLTSACDALQHLTDKKIRQHLANQAIPCIQKKYDIKNTNKELILSLMKAFD